MGLTLAKIETVEGKAAWSTFEFHRVQPAQVKFEPVAWKVVPKEGVMVQGEQRVRRTAGNPDTLKRVYLQYGALAKDFWDPGLILAIIANESRGELVCERYESRLGDYSFGPAQFLTGTAYSLTKDPPDYPVTKGGSAEKWRKFLCDGKNSVTLIRSFLNTLNKRFILQQDPLLLYASYNAGSPRPSVSSEWGLVTNRSDTLDKISAWYGDAWYVIRNFEAPAPGVA